MKILGADDIHKFYGRKKMSYRDFSRIINRYNKLIVEAVASGETWKMPLNMGIVKLVTGSRNFKRKRIDWPASHKLKQDIIDRGGTPRKAGTEEGENWIVYYTDDFYCRVNWDKKGTKGNSLRNWKVYKFYPAWGFKRLVAKKLQEDELNELV